MNNDYNERFVLLTGENLILDAQEDEMQEEYNENKEKVKDKDEESSKKHHSSEGSEAHSSKKGDEEKEDEEKKKKYKVTPYDAKKRKVITVKLAFFFLMGMIYFYLVFYTGYESLEKILREMPDQVNWVNRRK